MAKARHNAPVGVEKFHAAAPGEAVLRGNDGLANGEENLVALVRWKGGDFVEGIFVDGLEDAYLVSEEILDAGGRKEGRWRERRKPLEGVRVDVGVEGNVGLVVADGGVSDVDPEAFGAMAAGTYLNETGRADLGTGEVLWTHLDLEVGRTVHELESIENLLGVVDEGSHGGMGRAEQVLAVQHKVVSVGGPAVVKPDADDLVVAVTRDRIDDELVALEELLDENAPVDAAQAVDAPDELGQRAAHVTHCLTLGHAVAACGPVLSRGRPRDVPADSRGFKTRRHFASSRVGRRHSSASHLATGGQASARS